MTYLEKIKGTKLKQAVLKVYKVYGHKLYFLPLSLIGKHHPKDERGIGGLKNHIEKMCWFLDGVVARHMSQWYPNLSRPQTELEKMFALADFIVAREDFKIKREGKWGKIKRSLKH